MALPWLIGAGLLYGAKKLAETDCDECGDGFISGYNDYYCSYSCYSQMKDRRARREQQEKERELEEERQRQQKRERKERELQRKERELRKIAERERQKREARERAERQRKEEEKRIAESRRQEELKKLKKKADVKRVEILKSVLNNFEKSEINKKIDNLQNQIFSEIDNALKKLNKII